MREFYIAADEVGQINQNIEEVLVELRKITKLLQDASGESYRIGEIEHRVVTLGRED